LAPQFLVNTINPDRINEYPYTAYVYFIFFISPALLINISLAIYYTKHANMRRVVFKEAREYLLVKTSRFSS
jgi:hypothetical protein